MQAQELVGLWDSGPYDYGAMESVDLALLADGRGWTKWSNAAGGLTIRRLRWSSPAPGVVELRYTLLLSGEWDVDENQRERIHIESHDHDNEVVTARYRLQADTTPMRPEPFRALRLTEAVEFCHTFGLRRHRPTIMDDPTHELVPYPPAQ